MRNMNTCLVQVAPLYVFESPLEHNPARSEYSGETRSVSGSPPVVELPIQLKLAPTHLSMTSPPRCRAVSTGTWIVTAQSLRRLRKQIFTDPHGHSACRLGPVTCPTMPNRRRGMCPPRAAHNDRAPETSEAGHDTGTHSDTGPRSKHGQTIRGRFPNQRARSRDCLQQRRR
jgi:hypothetical protein